MCGCEEVEGICGSHLCFPWEFLLFCFLFVYVGSGDANIEQKTAGIRRTNAAQKGANEHRVVQLVCEAAGLSHQRKFLDRIQAYTLSRVTCGHLCKGEWRMCATALG